MVEFCLKFTNLKQRDIENIAKFVDRAEVLAKKLLDSQVNIGMAVAQEISDLDYKEKLLFKYVQLKNFIFSIVKTLIKALYFSQEKNNLFDPSYQNLRNVGLPLPIQLIEKLVRQFISILVQDI